MVVSQDKDFLERIRKLSYFGINKKAFERYEKKGTWFYEIEENGYKFNFDSIHAAMGLVQLEKLDWMNERRRFLAKNYREKLNSEISFTADSKDHYHTYHLFPIILPDRVDRDEFATGLKEQNIGSSVHFIPLHRHSYYRDQVLTGKESFPIADQIFEKILSLPMFPGMSDEDLTDVCTAVNQIMERADG